MVDGKELESLTFRTSSTPKRSFILRKNGLFKP